jgi:hypothetical protein
MHGFSSEAAVGRDNMWVTFVHAELLFIESIEVISFRDCYHSQVCDIYRVMQLSIARI